MELQAFDSSDFHGKSYFQDDDTQNYLEFQPFYKHSKTVVDGSTFTAWKWKTFSDESINPPVIIDLLQH